MGLHDKIWVNVGIILALIAVVLVIGMIKARRRPGRGNGSRRGRR